MTAVKIILGFVLAYLFYVLGYNTGVENTEEGLKECWVRYYDGNYWQDKYYKLLEDK